MTRSHFTDTDRAFYSEGYKLGVSVVDNGLTKDALFASIRTLYSVVDDFIEAFLQHAGQQGVNVACKKGCEWCCHQPIFAISHEILFLSEYITSNFSDDYINDIMINADNKNKKFENVKPDEIQNIKEPCPLLKDGQCSAYEARPMACRIYLSQRVATCLEFFKHPENKDNFPALLDFPLRAGRMMNEGFIAALKTQELHSSEYRIEQGLEMGMSTIASGNMLLKDGSLYL